MAKKGSKPKQPKRKEPKKEKAPVEVAIPKLPTEAASAPARPAPDPDVPLADWDNPTPEGVTALRRELARALKTCPPKCREWLRHLPKHNFQTDATARALGFDSSHASKVWGKRPDVLRARKLLEQLAAVDLGITPRMVLDSARRQVHTVSVADFYRTEDGEANGVTWKRGDFIIPPDWTPEMRAAVKKLSFPGGMPSIELVDSLPASAQLGKYLRMEKGRSDVPNGGDSHQHQHMHLHLTESPEFLGLMQEIADALGPYPEARRAVFARIEGARNDAAVIEHKH